MQDLLIVSSVVLSVLAGIFGWKAFADWGQKVRYKHSLTLDGSAESKCTDRLIEGESAFDAKVISAMRDASVRESIQGDLADGGLSASAALSDRFSYFRAALSSKWFCSHVDRAGLAGQITESGFCAARIRFALIFGATAAVVGSIFSGELCAIMLIAGACLGWRAPKKALEHRIGNRAHQMEHHLPEMLDVVALGMRSGLSFDASIKLYTSHFKTYLAREISNAQKQWLSGLERRDEALRMVARSYDSQIFKRIIETIIRSVRFGSSMVESLEEQSAEARLTYRTRREEQVAKAPVKMMIPTGTLILPAMLILVVGPVLLELMGGGL